MIDNISWLAVYPEIVLMVMGCVIVLADLGVSSFRRTGTYVLTMLTLAVVAIMQAIRMPPTATPCMAGAIWSSLTPWATGSSALPPCP